MSDTPHEIHSEELLRVAEKFLPHLETSEVAIAAPGEGEGFWNGASSAFEHDGVIYLAYRTRQPIELGRGQGVIIAKSNDGVHFETIQTIGKETMGAESLERPTLLRTLEGTWRLYLSCATTGTKHWRVELLEADSPDSFDPSTRTVVMPGSEHWAVKDTVISRHSNLWHCWATFHPLDIPEHEDRMVSRYATSQDGIKWDWSSAVCLEPRADMWDSRGARITAVVPTKDAWIAFYDGRATAEENYEERTGIAVGASPEHFEATGDKPFGQSLQGKGLRYLDIVPLADSTYRTYYEVATDDGSHELRTQLITE
jgi:hypothetical protein